MKLQTVHFPRIAPAIGWTVTILLVVLAVLIGRNAFPEQTGLEPWWRMWLIAFASWLGFKTIAFLYCHQRPAFAFLLWPGMDAANFRERKTEPQPNRVPPFAIALALMLGSAVLGLAWMHFLTGKYLLMTGTLGMIAIVSLLHFGLFALLANGWNALGFAAEPLMNDPWRAESLADFWGRRWNRGFSDIARLAVFRPLVRKFGALTGTLAGFLVSGIAHEIVISLPARAGWGLPTLYFLIQGTAVIGERRWLTTRPRLRRTLTWLVILAPSPLLFHPAFLTEVIAPVFQIPTPILLR